VIARQRATHVVIDTDVASWLLADSMSPAAHRFIGQRLRILSFVTVTEMRYGALRAEWGQLRLRRLERSLADFEVIQTNGPLINRCAELRSRASRDGHALAQKIHEADRWVAATAIVLGLELVAGDRIYEGVDGLDVHRIRVS
jgi:predicted nucleic acid-binding protein